MLCCEENAWAQIHDNYATAAPPAQSPRLVGLVSAAQFAGLLLGPLGGWVSDCFDRRRVVIASKLLAIPITLLVSWCMAARARLSTNLVVAAGFAFTFCQGLTFVLDQTSRRALVSDTVGLRLLPMAFAMESISSNVSNTLGAQFGGLAIQYLGGHGAVLRFLACLQAASSLLAWTVSAPSVAKAASVCTKRRAYCASVVGLLLWCSACLTRAGRC